MEKRQVGVIILVIVLLVILGGCGQETTKSIDTKVPTNQKNLETTKSSDSSDSSDSSGSSGSSGAKKEPVTEYDKSNNELGEADETGVVTELTKNGFVMGLLVTTPGTGADEGADFVTLGAEVSEVELTDVTEYKICTIKTDKGLMSNAERSAIAVDKTASVYGTKVGNKLIATKVIIDKYE